MKTPEDWFTDFYPVPAGKIERGFIPALEHSLKKWKGLTTEVMWEYGLIKALKSGNLRAASNFKRVFEINAGSCALCHQYIDPLTVNPCAACPIYRMSGKKCADEYVTWHRSGNASPMIKLLEDTLTWAKEKSDEHT